MTSKFADRVQQGAQFLDTEFPGWEAKINPEILNMASASQCICGQVAQDIVEDLIARNEDTPATGYDYIIENHLNGTTDPRYGFNLKWDECDKEVGGANWSLLAETWLELIKDRYSRGELSG